MISSDEEMEGVSGISTTAVKPKETGDEDSDHDDSDDDAEWTGNSSEESTDDEDDFGIKGLKEFLKNTRMARSKRWIQQMHPKEQKGWNNQNRRVKNWG